MLCVHRFCNCWIDFNRVCRVHIIYWFGEFEYIVDMFWEMCVFLNACHVCQCVWWAGICEACYSHNIHKCWSGLVLWWLTETQILKPNEDNNTCASNRATFNTICGMRGLASHIIPITITNTCWSRWEVVRLKETYVFLTTWYGPKFQCHVWGAGSASLSDGLKETLQVSHA